MSDGTSFTIDLPVTGAASVDAAASSVDVLAVKLDTVSKASLAASDAMKAGQAAYNQAETSADRAAKSLEKIGIAADAQRGKLKEALDAGDVSGAARAAEKLQALSKRQEEAAEKAAHAKAMLENEAVALDKLKAAAGGAEAAKEKLTTELEAARKAESDAAKAAKEGSEGGEIGFEGLERGLGKLGGPLGAAGQKVAGLFSGVGKLQKALGSAGPEVAAAVLIVALAAAFAAAAAAAVVATAKILEWSVGLADAARSAGLLSQGIARSVAGGQLLDAKIDSLTKTLPLTREELSQTAKTLADGGLRGQALADALERSATNAARLKFGPDFAKQMLSLDEQSKVFKANIASVFGGLKIEGLLSGMQTLVALFDSNTASGRALKAVFESLFQPLVDWIAAQAPKIEAFFLQLEIWTLKALIAIKPYGSTILSVAKFFVIVAAVIAGVFVVAIGLLVGSLALMVAFLALPIVLLVALGYGIYYVVKAMYDWAASITTGPGKALEGLKEKFTEAIDWLKGLSLAEIGRQMIHGLVDGIENAKAAVLASITGAVKGAIDGAKKLLGIASPSKVFADIGMMTGAGMADGVDNSAKVVQSSLENMVSPPGSSTPATPAAPAPAAPSSGGKGGAGSGNTFHFYGVKDAEDAIERFTRLLEGDAAQLGPGAVPVT